MLKEVQTEVQGILETWGQRLVFIGGGGIAHRTGIVVQEGVVASLAAQAEPGEGVTIHLPEGREQRATVRAWDSSSGLVLLDAPGCGTGLDQIQAGPVPALGSLVVTAAFPSTQGPEASLALVRFVGGATAWGADTVEGYFQTDDQAWPGFEGALLADAGGRFVGVVVEGGSGNRSWNVAAGPWLDQVGDLLDKGSRLPGWIGVGLAPVELSSGQSARAGVAQAWVVQGVVAGGPAASAGVVVGDLVLTLDGKEPTMGTRHHGLGGLVRDREVHLGLLRGVEVVHVTLVPTARPRGQ